MAKYPIYFWGLLLQANKGYQDPQAVGQCWCCLCSPLLRTLALEVTKPRVIGLEQNRDPECWRSSERWRSSPLSVLLTSLTSNGRRRLIPCLRRSVNKSGAESTPFFLLRSSQVQPNQPKASFLLQTTTVPPPCSSLSATVATGPLSTVPWPLCSLPQATPWPWLPHRPCCVGCLFICLRFCWVW